MAEGMAWLEAWILAEGLIHSEDSGGSLGEGALGIRGEEGRGKKLDIGIQGLDQSFSYWKFRFIL